MFYLIDYNDYNGVEPEYKLEDILHILNDKLVYGSQYNNLYWEHLSNIPEIYGMKCIFAGNKFYIIDTNPNKIIDGIVGQYYFESKYNNRIKYRELNTPKAINTTGYFLHKIIIHLHTMNLPEYYFDTEPLLIHKHESIFNNDLIFDNIPCDSFVYKYYVDNTDKKTLEDFISQTTTIKSIKTALISEKCRMSMVASYKLGRKHNKSILKRYIQLLETTGQIIDEYDELLLSEVFITIEEHVLRHIVLCVYYYLITQINENTNFTCSLKDNNIDIIKLRSEISLISGEKAKVPVYNGQICRHWQFILNPIKLMHNYTPVIYKYISVKTIQYNNIFVNIPQNTIHRLDIFWDFLSDILFFFISSIMYQCLIQMDYKYYVLLGGKSINNILNIKQSFDFDFHILDEINNYALQYFCSTYTLLLNTYVNNNPQYKVYLKNILLLHKLIEPTQIIDYDIFYYGLRVTHTGKSMYGIFIRLQFTNIFEPEYHNGENPNEIYFNIGDIVYEKILNFGKTITIRDCIIYDRVVYPNLYMIIFNLLSYINLGGYKKQNNITKLSYFFNIENYKCSFLYNNPPPKIPTKPLEMKHFIKEDVKINGNTFRNGTLFNDIYNTIVDIIRTQYVKKTGACNSELVLHHNFTYCSIFNDRKTDNTQILKILSENDTNQYISLITQQMDIYMLYKYLEIAIPENVLYNKCIPIISIDIKKINNLIKIMPLFSTIKPIITTYKCIKMQYIKLPGKNNLFTIEDIVNNETIIYCPTFMCVSYCNNYDFDNELDNCDYVLRISINKEFNNWIVIKENIILLDNNCYFIVKHHKYLTMKKNTNEYITKLVIDIEPILDSQVGGSMYNKKILINMFHPNYEYLINKIQYINM